MPKYPPYLRKEYNTYYAALEVPKSLRPKLGRRFYQSLGTDSEKEATTLAMGLVSDWKQQIEELRSGKRRKTYLEKAMDFQAVGQEVKSREDRELFHDELASYTAPWRHPDDEAYDPELAETFIKVAEGKSCPTTHHLDAWLASLTDEPKTLDDKRNAVRRFARVFPMTHDVTRQKVRVWAHGLLSGDGEGSGKGRTVSSPTTVRKIASHLRGYWTYLQNKGAVESETDPFKEIMPQAKKRTKAASEDKRRPFTDEELGRVLEAGERKGDEVLLALTRLAMWTGCRIEELCSLKLSEVTKDRFTVRDAKTKAGDRVVPLHEQVKPLVEDLRRRSRDGYLLSGLTFNMYGKRSNAIGKRFGRLKEELRFGAEYDFHCIRKTVATKLENAGVPEGIAADILGHKKQTMTYGLYSGGTDFRLKAEAIAKLTYDMPDPRRAAV